MGQSILGLSVLVLHLVRLAQRKRRARQEAHQGRSRGDGVPCAPSPARPTGTPPWSAGWITPFLARPAPLAGGLAYPRFPVERQTSFSTGLWIQETRA